VNKKVAILIKDNELSDYPADLLIDGEVIKSYNIEFELETKGVNLLIGKSLPSSLIKSLRDKSIIFLKIKSLEELKELNLDIILPKDFKNKRGWKCGKKGF